MLTPSQSFKIYEILNKHFQNEADSKDLVQQIENVIEQKIEKETNRLSTKEDVFAVKEDMSLLRQEIARLETKIAESKTDMIKWSFSFFAALALMILGLYLRK